MHRYLSIPIAAFIGILLVSGCSPNSASTNHTVPSNSPSESQNHNASPTASTSWRSSGGTLFLLQGKVLEINDRSPYSLKIRLEQVIVPGPPTSPPPTFPQQAGTAVTVRFKHPFPTRGLMQPKKGQQVVLGVKEYTTGKGTTLFWGSDLSQYFYKKNGDFYGENGQQLVIAT